MSKTLEIPPIGALVEWDEENGLSYRGTVTATSDRAVNVHLTEGGSRTVRLPNPTLAVVATALPLPIATTERATQPATVRLAEIIRSPLNPRTVFDEDGIAELADSIREVGLIQRLLVRPLPDGPEYAASHSEGKRWELIAGERRYRALTLLGREEVAVDIDTGRSDAEILAVMIAENMERRALNPIEYAASLQRLVTMGWTQKRIAEARSTTQSRVAHTLALLTLPPTVQEMLADGRLSASHGEALKRFSPFPVVCQALAEIVVEGSRPVKDLDGKLPFYPELQNRGLVVPVNGYRFPEAVRRQCDECPHKALIQLQEQHWGPREYCLLPDEAQRKLDAYQAEEQARQAALLEAVQSGAGGEVVQLRDLQYGTYERLQYDIPAGCNQECPCRQPVIGYQGQVEYICNDPKRFKKLKRAVTREKTQALKVKMDTAGQELPTVLETTEGFQRGLAIVTWEILRRVHVDPKRVVAAQPRELSEGLKQFLDAPNFRHQEEEAWPLLARSVSTEDVKFLAELLAREKLHEALVYQHQEVPPLVNFLLGVEKKRKGKQAAEEPTAPADPHLATCSFCHDDVLASSLNDEGLCLDCREPEGVQCARCQAELPDPIAEAFEELLHAGALDQVVLAGFGTDNSVVLARLAPAEVASGSPLVRAGRAMLTLCETIYCADCAPQVDLCKVCSGTPEQPASYGKFEWAEPKLCADCSESLVQVILPEEEAVTV